MHYVGPIIEAYPIYREDILAMKLPKVVSISKNFLYYIALDPCELDYSAYGLARM